MVADVNILDGLSKKKVNQSKLDQLSHAEIVNIPKNNVFADPEELKKIKFYESLNELKSVKRFLYNIEDINVDPSVDWKKVICIEIRKYNAKYLEVISEKLGIELGYLSHLKKLDASKWLEPAQKNDPSIKSNTIKHSSSHQSILTWVSHT